MEQEGDGFLSKKKIKFQVKLGVDTFSCRGMGLVIELSGKT